MIQFVVKALIRRWAAFGDPGRHSDGHFATQRTTVVEVAAEGRSRLVDKGERRFELKRSSLTPDLGGT